MKHIICSLLALLLMVGVVNADAIPNAVDPKNYPIVWISDVYLNAATAVTSGYIVQWDFGSSDVTVTDYDDRCNWVKLADAADDIWTAGVMVNDSCTAYTNCQIAVRGVVRVKKLNGNTVTTNTPVSTTSSGTVFDEDVATDETALGIAVNSMGPGIEGMVPVWIAPTICLDAD